MLMHSVMTDMYNISIRIDSQENVSMEDKQKKSKKKKSGKGSTILIVVLILAGLLVMLYPTISNLYNEMTGSYAIQEFNEQLSDRTEEELQNQRMMAQAYNEALQKSLENIDCPYEYKDIMDFGNGMMGYIEIPVIDVYLPVYHGVDESVLSKGVGHISKTAFPIGGVGNHSVLTGHTGLPSAELFTDLVEVQEGDTFYVHIAGETVAYQVDQILVVLPEEVDNILPVPGKDYCTLVTCTPYGVNSHRLLVRGYRVEYEVPEEVVAEVEETTDYSMYIGIGVGIGVLLTLVIVVYTVVRKKRKM